jgi:hypothetical protein
MLEATKVSEQQIALDAAKDAFADNLKTLFIHLNRHMIGAGGDAAAIQEAVNSARMGVASCQASFHQSVKIALDLS